MRMVQSAPPCSPAESTKCAINTLSVVNEPGGALMSSHPAGARTAADRPTQEPLGAPGGRLGAGDKPQGRGGEDH